MKIVNFFASSDGSTEYAVCDNGNVYRRHCEKVGEWLKWTKWVPYILGMQIITDVRAAQEEEGAEE